MNIEDNQLSEQRQKTLTTFIFMTNSDDNTAKAFLKATNWDINTAMDRYYSFGGDANKLSGFNNNNQIPQYQIQSNNHQIENAINNVGDGGGSAMNLLQSIFSANLDGNNNGNLNNNVNVNNNNNNSNDNSDQKQEVIRRYTAVTDIYTQIKHPRAIHLSETALNEFLANQCDFPIILKISNDTLPNNIITHVAVDEFSYQNISKALVPQEIMKQLGLKHNQQMKCIYVQLLPATKLVFEVGEEFLKEKGYMKHIRQQIGKFKCLTINDTISVPINDKQFELKVKNVSPQNEHTAVSLTDVQYSVDIEIESPPKPLNQQNKNDDKINQNDKNNDCPIVSSISSTNGAPSQNNDDNNEEQSIHHTKGGPFNNDNDIENVDETEDEEEEMEEDEDEDEDDGVLLDNNGNHTLGVGNNDIANDSAAFSDENDDGWGTSANEQHSDWDYDGQDYLPIQQKEFTPPANDQKINIEDEEELVRDPNSTADGNSSCNRPSRIKNVTHRAWICEHCHAINNLIDSMKRNYKCNCCAGRYRPGQKLIESAEQDFPEQQQEIYTVWICQCTYANDITWKNCSLCGSKKPEEGLNSFQTTEEPKVCGNNNNNMNNNGDDGNKGNYLLARNANGNAQNNNGERRENKQWWCTKCFQRNLGTYQYCTGCNKYRWSDKQWNGQDDEEENRDNNNNNAGPVRQRYYGHMRQMGNIKSKKEYPIFGNLRKTKMNKRLINVFGKTYRNECIANIEDYRLKNEWNKDESLANGLLKIVCQHSIQEPFQYTAKPLGPRAVSLNEKNGYIAVLTQKYILIIKPNGSCSFEIDTVFNIPKSQQIAKGWLPADLCRIRFIDHNIYVFHYDKHTIYRYDYDINRNCITFVSEIYDKYFTEAKITDIMVTNNLLIILFDRWLGVYKLYPSLEWYHAVAFSKSDNINIRSLEMSIFDDWDDRLPMEKECFIIDSQQEAVKFYENKQKQKKIEEDEKRAQEEKDEVLDEDDGFYGKYKKSIKNYIFLNCENHIIAIHPTNPTFDFLSVAGNVKLGQSYCMSRKYGTFWVGNEGDRIVQSSKYDENQPNIVCEIGKESKFEWKDFRMIPLIHTDNESKDNDNKQTKLTHKDIISFNSCLYDESYGISGRLLTQCTVSYNNDKSLQMFYQLFNQNELILLKQELEREDYFLMPGTDTKPFNLIIYVFEMLYGTDLIDLLLISPDFNLVYALPGNEEDVDDGENKDEKEVDIEDKEEEEEDLGIKNVNDLLVSGSKCLIRNKENKWCNGVVLAVIPPDDNNNNDDIPGQITEMLQIAYIESLPDGTEIEEKTLIARYDARLKYNESIPLVDKVKLQKEKWNIGDKCLYWLQLTSSWCPAEVIQLFKKDEDQKQQWIKIKYFSETDDKFIETDIKYQDAALNLNKLEDVVNKDDDDNNDDGYDGDNMELEEEEAKYGDGDGVNVKDGDVAMMKLLAEGPMDQSYIAIKAIGNEKAEKDEDLIENEGGDGVFVPDGDEIDMEIEQEGVNEINNNNQ